MKDYDELLETLRPYRRRNSVNFLGKEKTAINLHSGVSIFLDQVKEEGDKFYYIDNGKKVYLTRQQS